MRLSPPKNIVFLLSLILAVLAIVTFFVTIPFVKPNREYFLIAAWALLAAGNYFKGF